MTIATEPAPRAWTPPPAAPGALGGELSRWRLWLRRANGSTSFKIGMAILALYVVAAVVSSFYTRYDPSSTFVGQRFESPNRRFWFGTDRLGQDVFSRTLAATAVDLRITIASVTAALLVGVVVGVLAGYFGGPFDFVVMRLLEVKAAFPSLIFALVVVSAVGPGELNVIIVLAFSNFTAYARLTRAEVMSRRTWQYAEAARMVGASPLRVAFRHLLPNSLGPAVAYVAINAAYAILTVASLGYLGVGLEAGAAEWGAMIARGQAQVVTGQWWISFFPGLALLVLTAGFYLAGDGLRDILDVREHR